MNNDLHAETERLLLLETFVFPSLYAEDSKSHIRALDAKVREQEETIKLFSLDAALNDAEARIYELEAKLAEAEKEMMCPRCKSSYNHANHCTHCGETW